jgi:hypothetical protein
LALRSFDARDDGFRKQKTPQTVCHAVLAREPASFVGLFVAFSEIDGTPRRSAAKRMDGDASILGIRLEKDLPGVLMQDAETSVIASIPLIPTSGRELRAYKA